MLVDMVAQRTKSSRLLKKRSLPLSAAGILQGGLMLRIFPARAALASFRTIGTGLPPAYPWSFAVVSLNASRSLSVPLVWVTTSVLNAIVSFLHPGVTRRCRSEYTRDLPASNQKLANYLTEVKLYCSAIWGVSMVCLSRPGASPLIFRTSLSILASSWEALL